LSPTFLGAQGQVGLLLTRMGQPDKGLETIRAALRVATPNDPGNGFLYLFAAEAELELGHQQAALDWALRAGSFMPGSALAQAWIASIYADMGDQQNTAKYVAAWKAISPAGAQRVAAAIPTPTRRRGCGRARASCRAALGAGGPARLGAGPQPRRHRAVNPATARDALSAARHPASILADARPDAFARYVQAYRETVDWMYATEEPLGMYAEFAGVPLEITHQVRDKFFPKNLLVPDQVSGLDAQMADAVTFKYLTEPLTKDQLAELIRIPPPQK